MATPAVACQRASVILRGGGAGVTDCDRPSAPPLPLPSSYLDHLLVLSPIRALALRFLSIYLSLLNSTMPTDRFLVPGSFPADSDGGELRDASSDTSKGTAPEATAGGSAHPASIAGNCTTSATGASTTGRSFDRPSGVSATQGESREERVGLAAGHTNDDLKIDNRPVLGLSDRIGGFVSGIVYMTLPASCNYTEMTDKHFSTPIEGKALLKWNWRNLKPDTAENYEGARVALQGLQSYLSERRPDEYNDSEYEMIPRLLHMLGPLAKSVGEAADNVRTATTGLSVDNQGIATVVDSAKTLSKCFKERFPEAGDPCFMAHTEREIMSVKESYASLCLLTQSPKAVLDAWNTVRGLFQEMADPVMLNASHRWWHWSSIWMDHETDETHNPDLSPDAFERARHQLLNQYPGERAYDLDGYPDSMKAGFRVALSQPQKVLEMDLQPLKADPRRV